MKAIDKMLISIGKENERLSEFITEYLDCMGRIEIAYRKARLYFEGERERRKLYGPSTIKKQ
jgi:hypothetical protein